MRQIRPQSHVSQINFIELQRLSLKEEIILYGKSNPVNNLSSTAMLSLYKILYITYLLWWYYSLVTHPFITCLP